MEIFIIVPPLIAATQVNIRVPSQFLKEHVLMPAEILTPAAAGKVSMHVPHRHLPPWFLLLRQWMPAVPLTRGVPNVL